MLFVIIILSVFVGIIFSLLLIGLTLREAYRLLVTVDILLMIVIYGLISIRSKERGIFMRTISRFGATTECVDTLTRTTVKLPLITFEVYYSDSTKDSVEKYVRLFSTGE